MFAYSFSKFSCVNAVSFLKGFKIMPKDTRKAFYAVGRGRRTGIFDNWPDCKKNVEGIANAKYKKFFSMQEAEDFIKTWMSPVQSPQKFQTEIQPLIQPPPQPQFQPPTSPPNIEPEAQISQPATNPEVIAVNLRLSAFERRFDECLKQIGALTAEVSQLKSKITKLEKNNRSKRKDKDEETGSERSFSHRSEALQNVLEGAMDPIPIASSLRSTENGGEPRKRGKRRRSKSRSQDSPVNGDEGDRPSTSAGTDDLVVKKEKVDYTTFNVDVDEYVKVYTDGCCHHNGQPRAKAGIGIWFGDNHPLNVSQPLGGPATNNNGEIQAARVAIELAAEAGVTKLKIHTDSGFLLDCVNNYMHTWRTNGWRCTNGQPVKNRVELEKLDKVLNSISVKWEKVPAHVGIHGNEMADRLANEGARRYRTK